MLIQIKKSNRVMQKYEIFFSSEYGDGLGIWNNEEPEEYKEYYVEFDITETLIYNKDIFITIEQSPKVYIDNNYTCILGTIEEIDTELITIRIGKSLIMIEVDLLEGFKKGETILIRTTYLNIYDMNY